MHNRLDPKPFTGAALALLALAAPAFAQQAPPQQPPPGYQQPPPGYQQPPPGYQQPPPGYQQPPPPPTTQAPPPGYPPPAYPPPGAPGYPPQAPYPPQPQAAPPGAPPPGYPPPGYAPPPGYPPAYPYGDPNAQLAAQAAVKGKHQHDGFFLRMMIGPGYTHVKGDSATGVKATAKGAGPGFGIAVGFAPITDLALYAELFGTGVNEPKISSGPVSADLKDGQLSLGGIGLGAAKYIMPLNLYISGAVHAVTAQVKIKDMPSLDDQTDTGIGFNLGLGKEFWVSDNWGLGVASHFLVARMKDDGKPQTGIGWTLAFVATFN